MKEGSILPRLFHRVCKGLQLPCYLFLRQIYERNSNMLLSSRKIFIISHATAAPAGTTSASEK